MIPDMSVILLSCGRWDLVHARLAELYKYYPYEQELVWIDNGTSEEDALSGMEWWKKILPKKFKFTFYRFLDNQGFGPGHNKGAELATGKNLVFLSSDVIMRKPFSDMILASLATTPDSGLWGDRIVWWDGGWNRILDDKGQPVIAPYAEGYLLATSAKVWKKLGGFDPQYFPADCEDLDLSINAALQGIDIKQLPGGYFTHLGGQTANQMFPNRMAITERNKQLLDQKWKSVISKLKRSDSE